MYLKKIIPTSLILFIALLQSTLVHASSTSPIFDPNIDGNWIGNGISYSSYRDGESPETGNLTAKKHILEDLNMLTERWNLIRLYDASPNSERVLQVIHDNKLSIKVMQGVWLSGLQNDQQNNYQVAEAIRFANLYPNIVIAVNVGNEVLVDWSAHKMTDVNQVVNYVKQVKQAIKQPVSVNDDYNFWNKPHAIPLAEAVDFIGLHAYAFWNNKTIDESLAWTQGIYQDIQQRYPNKQLVLGETGWPTSRIYNDGSYEGGLIGKANVKNLQQFFNNYNQWIDRDKIVSFYFEAFDEKWKGGYDGANPESKAEKHWGVYYSNRKPKIALEN